MQAIFGVGHQTIEQRGVEAVQVFKRVRNSEAGAQVEMELGVADGGEIHQNDVAVRLLQGEGGIDGGRGGASASLGTEKGKDAGFAHAPAGTGAIGAEPGQGFEQSLKSSALVEVFAGSGAHAGHDGGGLLHGAVSEDSQLEGVGLNEFDGFDGGLRVRGTDINDDDFGAQVLNLAEDGVGASGREADVAEHHASQAGSLQAALQL